MIIQVNKDRTIIPIGTWGSMNENNYEILEFRFPEELESYHKRIVFEFEGEEELKWDLIEENKYILKNNVTKHEKAKAYIWLTTEKAQDFRTKMFSLTFNENQNPSDIIPEEEDIYAFDRLIKRLEEEIEKVEDLNEIINQAEQDRKQAEIERDKKVDDAVQLITDMTDSYNANAEEKTNDFNILAEARTDEFNENAEVKKDELNQIKDVAQDLVSAVTFSTFEAELEETGRLYIIQPEKMKDVIFNIDEITGRLEVNVNE